MSHPYAVFDSATGEVLRTGWCSNPDDVALQAGDEQSVDASPPEGVIADGRWTRASDGTYTRAEPPAKTLEELAAEELEAFNFARRQGYGSIQDQLDLIYHQGMDAWRNHIAQVKAQITKPNMTQGMD